MSIKNLSIVGLTLFTVTGCFSKESEAPKNDPGSVHINQKGDDEGSKKGLSAGAIAGIAAGGTVAAGAAALGVEHYINKENSLFSKGKKGTSELYQMVRNKIFSKPKTPIPPTDKKLLDALKDSEVCLNFDLTQLRELTKEDLTDLTADLREKIIKKDSDKPNAGTSFDTLVDELVEAPALSLIGMYQTTESTNLLNPARLLNCAAETAKIPLEGGLEEIITKLKTATPSQVTELFDSPLLRHLAIVKASKEKISDGNKAKFTAIEGAAMKKLIQDFVNVALNKYPDNKEHKAMLALKLFALADFQDFINLKKVSDDDRKVDFMAKGGKEGAEATLKPVNGVYLEHLLAYLLQDLDIKTDTTTSVDRLLGNTYAFKTSSLYTRNQYKNIQKVAE